MNTGKNGTAQTSASGSAATALGNTSTPTNGEARASARTPPSTAAPTSAANKRESS